MRQTDTECVGIAKKKCEWSISRVCARETVEMGSGLHNLDLCIDAPCRSQHGKSADGRNAAASSPSNKANTTAVNEAAQAPDAVQAAFTIDRSLIERLRPSPLTFKPGLPSYTQPLSAGENVVCTGWL